jgi:hypothetical protein
MSNTESVLEGVLVNSQLKALYNWFVVVNPRCFHCKNLINWDQRRFWEDQHGGQVYFFCKCGFVNPLSYLRFKWETILDLKNLGIEIR